MSADRSDSEGRSAARTVCASKSSHLETDKETTSDPQSNECGSYG
jgi:hypothetical protein